MKCKLPEKSRLTISVEVAMSGNDGQVIVISVTPVCESSKSSILTKPRRWRVSKRNFCAPGTIPARTFLNIFSTWLYDLRAAFGEPDISVSCKRDHLHEQLNSYEYA